MTNSVQIRLRRILGLSLYALAALWGLINVGYSTSGPLTLVFGATFASTITYWCIVDARIAGHPILYSFYWLIFLLWPLGVPIYLLWARKLRGLGSALLHVIGLFAVALLAYLLAGYLVYGNAWFGRLQ